MLRSAVEALCSEARTTNERRLLVLAGDRDTTYRAARTALDAGGITDAVLVGDRDALPIERIPPKRTGRLLGTTREAVVFDAHDRCEPNALGRIAGVVDGGGLLVLCTPPLDDWPGRRDDFDESLAVPPFDAGDVTGHFRSRLVATLRVHPGVAVVDADRDVVERDGLTRPPRRLPADGPTAPDAADRRFPRAAYEACLTADQVDALAAFEALLDPGTALVVEADRGRGKSSVAGLAAASLAERGLDVLVAAPERRSAAELLARARELLAGSDALRSADGDPPRELLAASGGRVRYVPPADAAALPGDPDAAFVDEAAALPVRLLERFLPVGRLAFVTTVHGYEGTGRGFDVRFRDRLAESDHDVRDVSLADPVRYAAGDPVEVWAFRALALDARPAVDPLVADAVPADATYRRLDPESLLADGNLLRETVGLLVDAHYRTEPNDLARLLDAPNVEARALTVDGHVVGVAMLAREGDLPEATRRAMYEGERIRGNMLPDVLTSQLRDEDAAAAAGLRVLRIAAHDAARSRGFGSRLLADVRAEFADDVDWLGVGYGATPRLLRFWRANGYATVHLSTTRNPRSGEHSALMLAPTSDRGRALRDRHCDWFAARAGSVLADALRDADPGVVRLALRATDAAVDPSLDDRAWRLVAAAAYGPALYSADPRPFRALARKQLVDPADPDLLSAREERLLVAKVLQARPAEDVAADLGYEGRAHCLRALGDAYAKLVDVYGSDAARGEADRYRDGRSGAGPDRGV